MIACVRLKLDLGGGGVRLVPDSLRNKRGVKRKRYVSLHRGGGEVEK